MMPFSPEALTRHLVAQRDVVEAALQRILPSQGAPPAPLTSAMRYSVLAGGKRLRPVLCLTLADVCGFAGSAAERAEVAESAAALELIHTYSLIHDDLPCMDDDSLRRGRPTCHVVHGEAMALLAGDALQTLGFEVLSTRPLGADHAGTRSEATAMVARAIGAGGMAGGQALDLDETGRPHEGEEGRTLLGQIHAMKTGRLLAVSASLGALYAGAAADLRQGVERYGDRLGLLFQIADDLLDVTADTTTLGKTAGKDSAQAKLTYPALFGVAGARAELDRVLEETCEAAGMVEQRDGILSALATWAARRDR